MYQPTVRAFSIATFSMAVGCGGADTSAGGSQARAQQPASSRAQAPSSAAATPAPSEVSIRGFVHASDGTLLAGASVCAQLVASDATDCAISGRDGSFSVQAPAGQPVTVTFRKDGYLPTLRAIATDTVDIALPSDENTLSPAVSPQTFIGAPVDASKGQIAFFVTSPDSRPIPDVSVTLSEYRVLPGPDVQSPTIYFDANGAPRTGQATGTSGGFANVPEGAYVLRFSRDSVTCTANGLYGYPVTVYQDGVSAAVLVPVTAGMITAPVKVTCTQ